MLDIQNLMNLDALTSLVTLSFMEVVLGIDNIVFIALLTNRLPTAQRAKARNLGIIFALGTRFLLLFSISWVMSLTEDLGTFFDHPFSVRDIILIGGGLFLIAKSTKEIHDKMEGRDEAPTVDASPSQARKLAFVVVQIMLLDIIFSLDSVITAVGMAQHLPIMITAMVIAMVVMLAASKHVSRFVEEFPTIKILALSFLILIGVFLSMEGMRLHVNKNYIYFAMFFSFTIEMINMRYHHKAKKRKK